MDNVLRIFDKLVSLRARSFAGLQALLKLAQDQSYEQALQSIEAWLKAQKDTQQQSAAGPAEPLQALLARSTALCQLFSTEPLFSSLPREAVIELAAFCDLAPDPEAGLTSKDGPFRRAAAAVVKGVPRAPSGLQQAVDALISDGLAKLFWIDSVDSRFVSHLLKLSRQPDWQAQMLSVEHCLAALWEGQVIAKENLSGLERAAQALVLRARRALQTDGLTGPLMLALQAPPFLAELLAEEAALFEKLRNRREDLERNLSSEFAQTAAQEKARFVAAKASTLASQVERSRVDLCFSLRVQVAREAWESRAFAKLYALEEGWEELADQFRANQSPLIEYETRINQPRTPPPSVETQESTGSLTELDRLRQRYQEDLALTALLSTKPTFGEIFRTMPEVLDFYAISRALVKAPRVAAEAAQRPQPIEQREKPGVSSEERPTRNVRVAMTVTTPNVDASGTNALQIHIDVLLPDGKKEPYDVKVDLSSLWANIFNHLELYRRSFQQRIPVNPAISTSALLPASRPQPTLASTLDTSEGLKAVGKLLYKEFFQGIWRQIITSVPHQGLVRLILEFPEPVPQALQGMPGLADLPWESLYVPDEQIFLGLINRYSIVRARGETSVTETPNFGPELRIMAVLAQPTNAPPIQIDRHRDTLQRLFERAKQNGSVKYAIIENPTVETLLDNMRNFRPNVFHFFGHGTFALQQQEGAIMLVDDVGNVRLVFAQDLRNWVKNLRTIQLAVINACESATASGGDVITGIAGALSDAGVPATVATTSQVFIETAERFTSEFYRALFSNYTVEAAVTEARNVLHASRVDWAPYALFANTENLDGLQIHRVLSE